MMENELTKIWQSSPAQERIRFEKSRLIIDMQANLDKINKSIRNRDLIEQGAAFLAVPLFLLAAWLIPFTLTKVAALLIVCWCLYVVYRLRKAKENQPGPMTASYVDYLMQSKKFLEGQKHLLERVVYWYILPPMVFVILFVVGMGMKGQELINAVLGAVGFGVAIYILNKKAVQNELDPRLKKIEEVLANLQESPSLQ